MEIGNFTIAKATKKSDVDTHHIIEKSICKRYGWDPYIYLNQITVEHYFHINKLTNNFSKEGKIAQGMIYEKIKKMIFKMIDRGIINVDDAELFNVMVVYKWATIKFFSKEFKSMHYEEIEKGYEIIKRESEMIEKEVIWIN